MNTLDVLIVDDEIELAETTKDYFEAMGIKTEFVTNKGAFLEVFNNRAIKLILLDINLGNSSGYEICRTIRKSSNIPIIFISVRTDDQDKVIALGVGGDDYMEKPYSLSVLVAKVKATLRRCYDFTSSNQDVIEFGDVYVDIKSRIVKVNGCVQEMTMKEFDLLVYLLTHQNKVIKKERLYEAIWGQNSLGELSTLTVHIRKIREKIENNPSHPQYLKTVWGIGYKFEV